MKLLISLFIIISYITLSNGFKIADNKKMDFKLNPKVGSIELNFVSLAPLEDIYGNVKEDMISSNISFNPVNPENISGNVTFKVRGMETGINKRDEHLYSSDWLDAAKYPEISFKIKSIQDIEADNPAKDGSKQTINAISSGEFTLHGVTKKIDVPIEMTYMPESDKTKKRASGDLIFVTGEFKIKLSDFKIKGANGIIGKKVGEEINIDFQLFYNSI